MSPFDYSSTFGAVYHGARRLPPQAENWLTRVRAAKLHQWISPSDRVLEYGVGFGWNLAALECAEKVGYDLTPELRQEVEAKGIRYEESEKRLEANGYDVIIAHHVLEHTRDPASCLALLKTLLCGAGKLLLFVPFERETKYRVCKPQDRAHHLYSWTPASLSRLVSAGGWRIERIQLNRFRFDRFAAVLTARLRGNFAVYRSIRALGLFFLPEYEIAMVTRHHI